MPTAISLDLCDRHRLDLRLMVCCSCVVFAAAHTQVVLAAGDKPNVVVILADDLGYGDLECYGHPRFKTPRLNQMAAEGARFTQFYAPTPYCAPSRGSLLTGRYPWRHGVWRNPAPDAPGGGINDVGIPDDEVTLGEAFKAAGYATKCIGKWHLGHKREFYPRQHGFDEYYGILYSNDMRPVQLFENDDVVEYPVVQASLTQRYTAKAVDFIERNKDRPFFLYLPHAMPHKPLAASEEFYRKSGAGLYGDVLAELDSGIGRVVDKLAALGLDERTCVVFTSDNGAWFGGSTGGLRGMKSITWEGGLRVPAIIRWPGHVPPGQVIAEPCGMIDIFPTVLTLADIPLPEGRTIDGRDLMPVLTMGATFVDRPLFGMQGNRLMTIRAGRYKLHVRTTRNARFVEEGANWIDPRAPDGVTILAPYEQYKPDSYPGLLTGDEPTEMMLFDMENDPQEQHNVAGQHPEVVAPLRAEFDKVQADLPAELRPPR
jgi:uncharacterized sulfatase